MSQKIKCQVCDEIATYHHNGNHFCVLDARKYALKARWKRVLFWHTPKGAIIKDGIVEACK